jgi:hypothetical protein
MATLEGTPKKLSELVACTAPNSAADYIILVANAGSNTEKCLVNDFFGNSSVNAAVFVYTTTDELVITDNTTPANSTANVTQGRFWYDDTYLYIAVGNNEIKRVTLEAF